MSCIAPERFVEMLETGRFDRPDPEVALHLAECPECRDAWAAIGAADEVLPGLRPARRRNSFRTISGVAAAVLLLLLGSMLWMEKSGRNPAPGSSVALQEAEKELLALIEQLKSDDAPVRERAEKSLVDLALRIGKDSLRWLRDQEKKAANPEVKSRITSVLKRLVEPRVLWTAIVSGTSFGAIAPSVDRRVCVFTTNKKIFGVDPATGKVLWSSTGDYRAHTTVTDGAVFAPVSKGVEVGVQALRPLTGERLWHHGIADLWDPPPEEPQDYYHDSTLVPSGPWLYTGTRKGVLICLDAATGKRRWASEARPGGAGLFHPEVRNGKVFAAEWGSALLAFDAETGKLLWQAKAKGIGISTPVVIRDRVYVATHDLGQGKPEEERGEILAFSATDGARIWLTDLREFGKGALGLVDAGTVLVAQAKTHLLGLSPQDGAVRWSIPCRRFGYSTMALDDRGRVYAGSDEGRLLVVEPTSGKVLLRFDPNSLREADEAPKVNYGDPNRIPDLGTAGCPAVLGRDVFMLSASGLAVAIRMSEFLGEPE